MPEYRLCLDPRNPGQFFACCGLIELAELLAPGGEARFAGEGREFIISTEAPVPPRELVLMPAAGDGCDTDKLEPLDLAVNGHRLSLTWWLNETLTGKSPLKTWGGQQTPRGILGELLGLVDCSTPVEKLFSVAVYTRTRLGVDARSAWEALDAGYSPNDINQSAITFPWVEVLSAVGLQGFRPAREGPKRFRYATWLTPLTLPAARAACAAPWPGLSYRSFLSEIAGRGQGYKTFLFAEGADHV
jgi:CRISPR-associated protein Csx14